MMDPIPMLIAWQDHVLDMPTHYREQGTTRRRRSRKLAKLRRALLASLGKW